MLLRICLIVAILGAGAVVAVNFVMVKPAVETVIQDRATQKEGKEAAQKDLATAKKDLTTARTTLTNTTKTLATTKTELDAAKNNAQALEAKNTALTDQLAKATANNEKSEALLEKWNQMKITPKDVVALQDNLKKIAMARDGAEAESKLFSTQLSLTQDELNRLKGTNNVNEVPPLPAGLKGRVLAVDPKYGFVVLNIGNDKGVLTNGIMMVSREGTLIGKVQIAGVEDAQSVANILPAWRRGEVMEGDDVFCN